jgi:hypothetical protein
MLKPVTPYVSDLVAHIFYYTQHMATVHYENGKLHVHKEIIDNAKKAGPVKESPASKKDNSASDHISILQNDNQEVFNNLTDHYNPYPAFLLYSYLQGDFPPPRI